MIKIAPSILSADFANLERDIQKISTADYVHVDVMDGVFVPNITIGIPVVKCIRPTTDLPLDVHLMIVEPVRYVEQFCDAGADLVTVHVESDTEENTHEALAKIHAKGKRAGVVLKPKTPAEAVLPFLNEVELVLVMTVEPGGPCHPRCLRGRRRQRAGGRQRRVQGRRHPRPHRGAAGLRRRAMKNIQELPRVQLGVFPTPFYRLERISETYGKNIWIKRDDMCGVALGGNKVRKLEFLLAEALEQGCDTVFTTGGAQSNHAMLTAACAARLGMRCILLLKRRGVTDHRGNLVLDDIFGAEVRMLDTDSYDDIYAEMHRMGEALERDGRKCCYIPVGGSTALGSLGYAAAVREFAVQALAAGVRIGHIVSATGSGGTTAGLLLGAKRFLPGVKVTGIAVDTDPFDEIVPRLAEEAAGLLEWPFRREKNDFEMVSHVGPGYAVPNPEDTPYIEELARREGILLDPVYTGKAFAGMMELLRQGYFGDEDNLVFVHTGGAGALFAMDLPR